MIDILQSKIQNVTSQIEKINIVREFLQILILKSISDAGYFSNLVFLGGTTLRIVHNIRRYSEDLDFSLFSKSWYDFETLMKKIKSDVIKRWFVVDVSLKDKVVQSAFVGFSDILQKLWLSTIPNQKLSIKLEIDTNPPDWWICEKVVINDTFIFAITVFDLPSLMAGKLHAILFRWFTKGRDWYDLLRYLTKWIVPNEILFQQACIQTRYSYELWTWKLLLKNKIEKVDFEQIKQDVSPFIFDSNELGLFSSETFLSRL